jgi:membrane-bound lytic murein transglycosylase B
MSPLEEVVTWVSERAMGHCQSIPSNFHDVIDYDGNGHRG